MDTVKIRELPQKSGSISLTDLIIVEDNDGTKTTEVGEFRSLLQQSIFFNTVEDMKNATFKEGDVVQTLGYREVNDGGAAIYKILYAPTDLNDGMLTHYLRTSDTLRAHLVHNGTLNILQCGAFGDGVNDDFTFITKALKKGFPLFFPKRTYKVSGPLEFPSGSVVDLNGSTLFCSTSSCICLGLDEDMSNIIIKNGTFIGKYGIEIYPYSTNVTITDCLFDAPSKGRMEKAICINGSSDIVIQNCMIGKSNREVAYGIIVSSGLKKETSYGNRNILISSNRIIASKYCINTTSTIKDRGIIISDNICEGYGSNRSTITAVGVQISSNSDSIQVASCGFNKLHTGIVVTGVVDVTLGCSDIICDDVRIMYSILSDAAKVTLSGMQKFNGASAEGVKAGEPATNVSYIFDRMTGRLYLNTIIDVSTLASGASVSQALTSLVGDLIDSIDPICREKVVLTKPADLNENLNNKVPGYMNIALDISYTGNITDLVFPSLDGQLVALYSSAGAILKANNDIRMVGDVILNQYTPVILRHLNGQWFRVA